MLFRLSLFVHLFLVLLSTSAPVNAQDGWDWRDPNDFNIIDLGDNKVIGYNILGIGVALLIDKKEKTDKGAFSEIHLSRYTEYRRSPLSDLWTIDYRLGKSPRKYLSWGGGVRGYLVEGDDVHTVGCGAYAWFRWHIIRSPHFRLSYDNGVGPNYFLEAFPSGGTRFNFTTHYGLSFAFLVAKRWWHLAFSNIHISNAGIRGQDRNPSLDAIGMSIGTSLGYH